MRINTRFTVAVHLMALLALKSSKGQTVTSEMLALSVGTNPVVIRQMISHLKKAGLITTRNGVPGAELTKKEEDISLLEIYQAVQKKSDAPLFDLHPNPNATCVVGRNIGGALEKPLQEAQAAMERSLLEYSLKDITMYICEKAHL